MSGCVLIFKKGVKEAFMKYMIVITFLFLFLGTGVIAKPYYVPSQNIEEIKQYRQFLAEDPSSANIQYELAMRYAYSGFIQEGWDLLKTVPKTHATEVVQRYEGLLSQFPEDWKVRFKLAFGYYFQGRVELSSELFRSVLDLNPKHVWTMGFIALLEGLEGDGSVASTDLAIRWCQRALEIEPNATSIHLLIAEGYRRKGDVWTSMGHMMKVGQLLTKEKLSDEFLDE